MFAREKQLADAGRLVPVEAERCFPGVGALPARIGRARTFAPEPAPRSARPAATPRFRMASRPRRGASSRTRSQVAASADAKTVEAGGLREDAAYPRRKPTWAR